MVAPVSDLLRNKRLASERARRFKVPWGTEQYKALTELKKALTLPPILVLQAWKAPFQIHTDASKWGAGEASTQLIAGSEWVIGYDSHRWSRTDAKRWPTKREVMVLLWAADGHRPYLWGRNFTLTTDCAVLMWLLKNQSLVEAT